jgi:hypothetical protein
MASPHLVLIGAAAAFFVSYIQDGVFLTCWTDHVQIYDYFLTLDLEVRVIWGPPWSIPKSLFLLNRYLPFLEMLLNYFRA